MKKEAPSDPRYLLIVEDNSEARSIFVEAFQAAGYRVLAAGDGEEAFQVLKRSNFQVDVILTDLRMPGMDGLEFASKIRSDTRYARIPIVLLSATPVWNSSETQTLFSTVLLKPCSLALLISTVDAVAINGD
nr:response regulator [Herbaspirillum sp. ASV7]